jgi:hypothetical protein
MQLSCLYFLLSLSLFSPNAAVTSLGGAGVAHHQASEEVLAKAKHLKEEANKKHQARRFEEAIKLYTEALALPLLPKEELAVLHSNRSAAHLADGDLSSALQDAKEAQRLRPTWPKGYFRKGQALFRQRNWPKALKGTRHIPPLPVWRACNVALADVACVCAVTWCVCVCVCVCVCDLQPSSGPLLSTLPTRSCVSALPSARRKLRSWTGSNSSTLSICPNLRRP